MTEQPTMNEQQLILVQRLKEKELSVDRFLKVGPDKAAFEFEFQKHPYSPSDLSSYDPCFCKYCQGNHPHKRWGILGKDFLVLVDTDKKEMYNLLSKVLPETLEVTSPRRGLPHQYYCVCGEQVPNKTLYLDGDVDDKGRPNGSGEIRANNEYLVAPGTEIAYKDLTTKEEKTGIYVISKNVPIARIEYAEFMAVVKPYFGKNQSQTITPEEMANGVSTGMRHAKGIRYACHLIGKTKLDAQTALFEMQRWNQLNNPPMEEKDLKRQVRDACRYIANENQIPLEQVIGCGGIKNPIFVELDQDEQEPTEKKTQDNQRESQADRAVKLCLDKETELFSNQYNVPYARITVLDAITQLTTSPQLNKDGLATLLITHENIGEESKEPNNVIEHPCKVSEVASNASLRQNKPSCHKIIIPVKGTGFKTYLAGLMYESEQKVIGSEALSSALNVLHYNALCGKKYTLYNRVAPDPSGDGSIWLDMADSKRRAYHATKDGWTLEVNPPILFKHYEHQEPLAEAVKKGDPWKLLEYVNVGDADKTAETSSFASKKRLLFMVQCASYLIPDMPHPILAVYGCKGTWKSSSQAFVRGIFDPSSVPLLSFPRDEHALIAQLEHHWIPIFDNLSSMPRWFSDALCRAVTGAGQETRELYTDDGVVIRQFKRCPMLNGLNVPAQHGDLLDRTILHETVVKEGRRTEAELKTAYLKDRPEILGGFLDAVVIALGKYPDVKPSKLFRLADFTRWGCGLAEALGRTSNEFIEAYEDNVKSQNEETAHASIVATAFIAFCEMLGKPTETDPFVKTPEDVFHEVENKASTMGINIKQKTWPKSPQAFTRKLNEAKDAIASLGVHYDVVPKGITREFQVWITDKTQEDISKKAVPKWYCSVECGNFDKPSCRANNWQSLNKQSEIPLKCSGYAYVGVIEEALS